MRESTVPITPVMKRCIEMGYDRELVEAAAERKRRSGGGYMCIRYKI